jgi:hypothetical protein
MAKATAVGRQNESRFLAIMVCAPSKQYRTRLHLSEQHNPTLGLLGGRFLDPDHLEASFPHGA